MNHRSGWLDEGGYDVVDDGGGDGWAVDTACGRGGKVGSG